MDVPQLRFAVQLLRGAFSMTDRAPRLLKIGHMLYAKMRLCQRKGFPRSEQTVANYGEHDAQSEGLVFIERKNYEDTHYMEPDPGDGGISEPIPNVLWRFADVPIPFPQKRREVQDARLVALGGYHRRRPRVSL
jgi:hypothetical protein